MVHTCVTMFVWHRYPLGDWSQSGH